MLQINQSLIDDLANELYQDIIINEGHSVRGGGGDEDAPDAMLISDSGLYELNYDDECEAVCYIKKIG